MNKLLTILFCLIGITGFAQQRVKSTGPDTTTGLNKMPSHLWDHIPLNVRTPLYNDTDSSFAIDPTYYYKKDDADSALASKPTLLGTLNYLQRTTATGIDNSWMYWDSSSTSVSKNLLIGQQSNVVLNPYFSSPASWEQQFSYWTISGGVATANAPAFNSIYQHSSLDTNVTVIVEYDITAYTSGSIRAVVVGAIGANNSGVGHYIDRLVTNSSDSNYSITIRPDENGFVGSVDNFTVRPVTTGSVSIANDLTANKLIKAGGTSTQHLMANGITTPLLTLTTSGSGAATLDSATRVLNIPTPAAGTGGLADSIYFFKQGGNYTPGFLGSLDATALNFRTTNTLRASFDASGNLNIINGGNNNVRLLQTGQIAMGTGSMSIYPASSTTPYALDATSGSLRLGYANAVSAPGYSLIFTHALASGTSQTSGANGTLILKDGFAPTSGTGTWAGITLDGVINQTGGASGITRGIHIAQTLTAFADNRALEISNTSGFGIAQTSSSAKNYFAGSVGIGTATPNASALFDITTTTQGFLPPRMTNTQKTAISSPATGLTVYCTDCTATDASTGVMQTYNGSTWKNNW